eukprot:TRINITY_DN66629_c0_g1_i1.p1 TRINITY_DN66629_c0_g1~~TRINITY_DN66629_c0_g1_i1.p1  ORF type:complete len:1318 (+),score=104.39 TRINITY_DN66629_c0_g1_i1:249-3956(+)
MDREVNHKPVMALQSSGNVEKILWKQVQVGSMLLIKEDELIPADMLILATSDMEAGLCYVETANLDGETNLKPKESVEQCHLQLKPYLNEAHDQCQFGECANLIKHYKFETEGPNDNLHAFVGSVVGQTGEKYGVANDQVVYRGCTIRNSKWILGIVVFTGMETKLMKNAIEGKPKRTTLDKATNRYLIGIFILLAILCVTCGVLSGVWIAGNDDPIPWYLDDLRSPVVAGLLNIVTFLILMSALIPISLTVTMEMVKVVHALFINQDIKMAWEDPETNQWHAARARTSNLSEDLGRIEYIFSDKTGTLTQNVMEFMKCSIGGEAYGTGTTEIGRAAAKREGREIKEEPRPANLHLTKGDNFYDSRISQGAWQGCKHRDMVEKFFLNLAVCHTVMAKPKEGSEADASNWTQQNVVYKASSPDEEALVIGARGSGFWFKRRIHKNLHVVVNGEEQVWELLSTNEFNSTRKRMSVIVRNPQGQLVLMAKGADSVMFERMEAGSNVAELRDHLRGFANEGLRTLVLAERNISQQEYEEWNAQYVAAFTSQENREGNMEKVAALIERDWTIVGATAIEDKLQDGVPSCIRTLSQAHIQIWILTGDKVETAINIAMACDLIDLTMELEKVSLPDAKSYAKGEESQKAEDDRKRKEAVLQQLREAAQDADQYKGEEKERALVIDGYSLEYALQEEERLGNKTMGPLLLFANHCRAVVCCRVSPKQKAAVVQIMRTKHSVITLAIGDGANDVGMIQTAHIGVGISGREGVQAVQASDYAIAQFRYLQQLVLIHGRWDYQRISILILFSFYKNIAFSVANVWFGIYSGFSGVKYWDDLYQSVWNVVFTAVPIIAVAVFDKDMIYQATLHAFPGLYKTVQRGDDFKWTRFLFWTIDALWCGLVVFFVPLWILDRPTQSDMVDNDKWLFSYTAFACCSVAVNLRLAVVTKTWTLWTLCTTFLSILTYFVWSMFFTLLPIRFSHQLRYMFYYSLSNGGFWASLVITQIMSLTPALTVHYFRSCWKPSDVLRVAMFERRILKEQSGIRRIMPEAAWQQVLHLMLENRELEKAAGKQIVQTEPVGLPPSSTADSAEGPAGLHSVGSGRRSRRGSIMLGVGHGEEKEEYSGFSFSKDSHADPEVQRSASCPNPWRGGRSGFSDTATDFTFASGNLAVPRGPGSTSGIPLSGTAPVATRSPRNINIDVPEIATPQGSNLSSGLRQPAGASMQQAISPSSVRLAQSSDEEF